MNGISVLVFANKQDLDDVLTAEEIAEVLKLDELTNRKWNIVACSAKT